MLGIRARRMTWELRRTFCQFDLRTEMSATQLSDASWSNHGPRIRTNRYLRRFWEPPASRIFNQLPVNRVLSRRKRGFKSRRGRQ